MNPHLAEIHADMERARQDAEEAKRIYNQKARVFNEQLARYQKAKYDEIETRLVLEREAQRANAEGNHALAVLISQHR